jgi:hypothetical protein
MSFGLVLRHDSSFTCNFHFNFRLSPPKRSGSLT